MWNRVLQNIFGNNNEEENFDEDAYEIYLKEIEKENKRQEFKDQFLDILFFLGWMFAALMYTWVIFEIGAKFGK